MSNKKTSILIVDDERAMRKLLRINLEPAGFKVEEAMGGEEAIRMAASSLPIDMILLDLKLHDKDGKEVIRTIREWSQVPIIVVSGNEQDEEVVAALEAGANDFINKPFNKEILLARINVHLRESIRQETGDVELINGKIHMNLMTHKVHIEDEQVFLTPKEYDLLRYFMQNCNRMLLYREILKEVWGPSHTDDVHYLRVYVSQLREKIQPDEDGPEYIVTESGVGYRMERVENEDPLPLPAQDRLMAGQGATI